MAVILLRSIGGVFVDVVIRERLIASMETVTHPVESGAKISDHAWRSPTILTMQCAASADPALMFQALFSVMKLAEPFTIVTGFGIHENMLLTRLEPSRDVETGRIFDFDAELTETIIVSTSSSGSSASDGYGDERGAGDTNRGDVDAREVSPGQDLLDRLEVS